MAFDFTTPKDGFAGRSAKWGLMDAVLDGGAPDDAMPMWIAQMDFQPAPVLQQRMRALTDTGEYGYFTGLDEFFASVAWWYENRHGWTPDTRHMFATHGLGNAICMVLQALTTPGAGVIVFSPVYHEFSRKIAKTGRQMLQSPLRIDGEGLFRMDLDGLEAMLTGKEEAVLISAPHNPAGRVWSAEELQSLGDFCARHDLLLISDEIHQDLVFGGHRHIPTAVAAPGVLDRLVVTSAASKTFDIAGLRTGVTIIPDADLRARFAAFYNGLDIAPNRAGVELTRAAYSPEGAEWLDELLVVLDGNRQLFCDGMNAIPGISAMPMQATFLAWVDFTGTGLTEAEIDARVAGAARIVATPGPDLGIGGDHHRRFNFAAPRRMIAEAVERLQEAFADLQ